METVKSPPEQHMALHNISWDTYEGLLADRADSSAPRFTYDRGTLEIMSPSAEHEESNRALAALVEVVAEELDLDLRNLGSTTFRREDLQRGFEPDSCFYLHNEPRVRGKGEIDLTVDPPPDLVIEIDITKPSLDKLPIYAQVGVPEIWRYDGRRVAILTLAGATYAEVARSRVLPALTGAVLSHFSEESRAMRRADWLRRVRAWTREHDRTDDPAR
jgi:Uma2 family endonuclease